MAGEPQLISCYNRRANAPYNENSTSSTVPVEMVSDEALMEADVAGLKSGADFLTNAQIKNKVKA